VFSYRLTGAISVVALLVMTFGVSGTMQGNARCAAQLRPSDGRGAQSLPRNDGNAGRTARLRLSGGWVTTAALLRWMGHNQRHS
jgi:hypothetical protein